MIETRKVGTLTEISSTTGYVHKKGTEQYAKRRIMLPGEETSDFEEADSLPPYTNAEYGEKVEELIRARYSASQELALINNAMADSPTEEHAREYAAYQEFRRGCKAQAREELTAAASAKADASGAPGESSNG